MHLRCQDLFGLSFSSLPPPSWDDNPLRLLAIRPETPGLETEDFTTQGSSSRYGSIAPQFFKPQFPTGDMEAQL